MTQTIRWKPATSPNIVAYVLLYSDTGPQGTLLERAQIMNAPTGPNYDASAGLYYYLDDDVPYRLYRLRTIDARGTVFDDTTAAPFAANNDPATVPVANVTPVNENWGGTNALQYVTPDGVPIADATVRIYTLADWQAQRYSKVVGLTKTNSAGGWVSPILVEPGNTFVVQYHLPDQWGPDTLEITI